MFSSGNPCQTPGFAVKVEPKLADPEIPGSDTKVGGWLVWEVAADQRFVVPRLLTFVVLTVMNQPASAGT
jgi:hypothetical protein